MKRNIFRIRNALSAIFLFQRDCKPVKPFLRKKFCRQSVFLFKQNFQRTTKNFQDSSKKQKIARRMNNLLRYVKTGFWGCEILF